jgi:hypothetical protein
MQSSFSMPNSGQFIKVNFFSFTYCRNLAESDLPFIKRLVILSVFSRVNSWFDGFCNKVPKYASNVSSHSLFTGDYFNNFIQFQTILLTASEQNSLITYMLNSRVRSDRIGILKKYAYGPDRTRTVQIRVWSGTYASCIHVL